MLMAESEVRGKLILNGEKMEYDVLAQILGIDNQKITTTITTLITRGVARLCPTTGALMSKRMVEDTEKLDKRRACGALGGNPKFKKGLKNPYYQQDTKDNHPHNHPHNQKITPSSSASAIDIYKRRFEKPTLEIIKTMASESGLPETEAIKFWNFYESKGWKVGKNAMVSLSGAFGGWAARWRESVKSCANGPHRPTHDNPYEGMTMKQEIEERIKRKDT